MHADPAGVVGNKRVLRSLQRGHWRMQSWATAPQSQAEQSDVIAHFHDDLPADLHGALLFQDCPAHVAPVRMSTIPDHVEDAEA